MPTDGRQDDPERASDSSLTKAAEGAGDAVSPDEHTSEEPPLSMLPPEIAKALPPKVRATFEQSFMMRSGPMQDPVRQKITEQHISDIIKQSGEENQRHFESEKHGRWMGFSVLALILIFVFALYVLFRDKPESVQPVLTHLIAFGGGIGGGMYLARKSR